MLTRLTTHLSASMAILALIAMSGWFAQFVPLPVPLVGLIILLLVLFGLGSVPRFLVPTVRFLLNKMSLFYIPAVIGVGLYVQHISPFLLAISLSLLCSTLISMLATAWLAQKLDVDPDE